MPTGKGLDDALREGKKIGCTAVQVFTSSPRQWKSSPVTRDKAELFKKASTETKIDALISHDSYLINLADEDPEKREKSIQGLTGEIERSAAYGIPLVVSHMGSRKGQDLTFAQTKVAEAALQILDSTPNSVTLLMETTAGQGSSLNSTFEEIATILEMCKNPDRLAVCLDTCHIFVAGYDIRTPEAFHATFQRFEELIGFSKLKAVHANDSKKDFGSHVDRHENIGEGFIGPVAFQTLVNDSRFDDIPIVVETPSEDDGHAKNVAKLRDWAGLN
jgi:deoxyribonuclease-4